MSDPTLNLEFAEVSKPEFTERTIFHVGVSGAAGSWQDDPPEPSVISCNSGFCE